MVVLFFSCQQSGGLHNDMAVHDFDMARFLVGSEVAEVYCKGSCKVSLCRWRRKARRSTHRFHCFVETLLLSKLKTS